MCQRQSEFRLALKLLGTGCAIGERDAGAEGEPFRVDARPGVIRRSVKVCRMRRDHLGIAGVDVVADDDELLRAALEMSRGDACRKTMPR